MILKREDIDKASIEHSIKKEVEKQHKLLYSIKPHKGHTLYKIHKKTLEISLVDFETQDINYVQAMKRDYSQKKKVIKEEDYIYVSCLNIKNVHKRLKRDFNIIIND